MSTETEFASAGLTAGQLNAIVKKLGGKENALALLHDEIKIVRTKILEHIGIVKIPATSQKFVAKDHFKLKKDGGICSWFGSNFQTWFLEGESKIEEPIEEQELGFHKLTKNSVDGPIIEELGGKAKAETTLQEVFALISKQPKGEEGDLLTDGYANIFYVRDKENALRAVGVYWRDDGWLVYAYSVEDPGGWHAGYQVFSRNS